MDEGRGPWDPGSVGGVRTEYCRRRRKTVLAVTNETNPLRAQVGCGSPQGPVPISLRVLSRCTVYLRDQSGSPTDRGGTRPSRYRTSRSLSHTWRMGRGWVHKSRRTTSPTFGNQPTDKRYPTSGTLPLWLTGCGPVSECKSKTLPRTYNTSIGTSLKRRQWSHNNELPCYGKEEHDYVIL